MSTKINISYQKKDYTLEYSRESVRQMESTGFVLDQVGDKPMTMIPLLFYGAFFKNHRGIKRKLVDEIFEHIPNKFEEENGLMAALIEMYSETIQTLTDDKDIEEGNVAIWEVKKG